MIFNHEQFQQMLKWLENFLKNDNLTKEEYDEQIEEFVLCHSILIEGYEIIRKNLFSDIETFLSNGIDADDTEHSNEMPEEYDLANEYMEGLYEAMNAS